MKYVNIISNDGPADKVPGGVYGSSDYHGSPPWSVALSAGWRKVDDKEFPAPPHGEQTKTEAYVQDPLREDYALGKHVYEVIPEVEPTLEEEIVAIKARLDGVENDVTERKP